MKIKNIILLLITCGFIAFTSCEKDDQVEAPTITNITLLQVDPLTNTEAQVTDVTSKKQVTIYVESKADLCTAWPAGDRVTVKSKLNPSADSVDIYNNVVLTRSDNFTDYGLVGAKGRPMSFSKGGFSLKYTYNTPGTYLITIIATNHGYNSTDYRKTVISKEIIVQ